VHDPDPAQRQARSLEAGLRVSLLSVLWTIAAGASAIIIGMVGGSLVLVVFGAIGLLDAAGSTALVVHFRHALRHEVISERHERAALLVVTVGMVVVGLATAAESAHRLIAHGGAESLPIGIALAGASVFVLAALAVRKRRISRLIPSHALGADAWLSAAGAALALITLCGTALNAALGWWWLDAVAATIVASGAIGLGFALVRADGRDLQQSS
jgi:divalent metal cation (Fe/Co/Zn/Cd) transporter